jgi:transcriptional regulator with XRE-family HTH domain
MNDGKFFRAVEGNKLSADTGIPGTTHEVARRSLGDFLRLMRDRAELAPDRVKVRVRRRVRGLRREEVSSAAGISVTWYTWLEQGRPVRVSRRTVQQIGRALKLSPTERTHLLQLADAAMHPGRDVPLSTQATPLIRRLVESLAPHPAYAINGLWDVLYCNSIAMYAFGRFDREPGVTDNVLRRVLLDAEWRDRFEGWDSIAASVVAQFRAATGHLAADPDWRDRVAALRAESALFAELWDAHRLAPSESYVKVVLHPTAGRLPLLYTAVQPAGGPADVRVVIYTPQDEATAERLRGLDRQPDGVRTL